MPGPKMGPRPADFDEGIVRQSPTFQKWMTLAEGDRLRYACREFVKGHGDDQERLMRRIMIARRNNLRDHENLKRARAAQGVVPTAASGLGVVVVVKEEPADEVAEAAAAPKKVAGSSNNSNKRRKTSTATSTGGMSTDEQVMREMDVAAVEATRSYKSWQSLPEGKDFVYNQKYTKGKPTHDWLLRKNIWRRMRYRRENKKMVQALQQDATTHPEVVVAATTAQDDSAGDANCIVDDALLASAAAAVDKVQHIHKSVVDAAVAAAENYVKSVDPSSGVAAAVEAAETSVEL